MLDRVLLVDLLAESDVLREFLSRDAHEIRRARSTEEGKDE
jgi:hypothetical protein